MARTIAHQPFRVLVGDQLRIDHDHRNGRCEFPNNPNRSEVGHAWQVARSCWDCEVRGPRWHESYHWRYNFSYLRGWSHNDEKGERIANRMELRNLAKLHNAGHDLEEFDDPEPYRHRHSAVWNCY